MFNQVFAVGRLVKDIELRYTPSGKAVGTTSFVTDSTRGKEEPATFFKITLWEKTAENASKYLSKGSKATIIGTLVQERWEKDGQKHSTLSVTVHKVIYLDSKPQSEQSEPTEIGPDEQDDDNEIPF